jgi:hypothetical protein
MPAFPFGATANPDAGLPAETVRETIAEMVARVVGPPRLPAHPGRAKPAEDAGPGAVTAIRSGE